MEFGLMLDRVELSVHGLACMLSLYDAEIL
jgi:hypothetical protein